MQHFFSPFILQTPLRQLGEDLDQRLLQFKIKEKLQKLTLPEATNSRWADAAAFTRALAAPVIARAASRICSSKLRLSSACYGTETISRGK